MTPEQRTQAEGWAQVYETCPTGSGDVTIAALLRAGVAASEECERLRALLERAAGLLRFPDIDAPWIREANVILAEQRRIFAVLDRLEAEARERIAAADQPPVVEWMRDYHQARLDAYARVRAEVVG